MVLALYWHWSIDIWPVIINLYYAWNKIHCLKFKYCSLASKTHYYFLPSDHSIFFFLRDVLIPLHLLFPLPRTLATNHPVTSSFPSARSQLSPLQSSPLWHHKNGTLTPPSSSYSFNPFFSFTILMRSWHSPSLPFCFSLCVHFRLHWVSVAVHGLSLVAASGGCSRVVAREFLIAVASLTVERGSWARGLQ